MPGYEYKLISYSYPEKDLIEKYKNSITEISNPLSRELIDNIMLNVEQIEKEHEENNEKKINE